MALATVLPVPVSPRIRTVAERRRGGSAEHLHPLEWPMMSRRRLAADFHRRQPPVFLQPQDVHRLGDRSATGEDAISRSRPSPLGYPYPPRGCRPPGESYMMGRREKTACRSNCRRAPVRSRRGLLSQIRNRQRQARLGHFPRDAPPRSGKDLQAVQLDPVGHSARPRCVPVQKRDHPPFHPQVA